MFRTIVFVCGVACALSANAQSSNFEGASVALNYNKATLLGLSDAAEGFALGESSNNASIQGAYSFALNEKALLSVGATYALGDLKAGDLVDTKIKNFYTVYIEPAYVINAIAIYGKLAYLRTKVLITISEDYSENFTGTGYGIGVRSMLNKKMYLQVELMNVKFNTKTLDSLAMTPGGTIGTVGIGYKF